MRTESGRHGRVEALGKAAAPPPLEDETVAQNASQGSILSPPLGSLQRPPLGSLLGSPPGSASVIETKSSISSLVSIGLDSPELGSANQMGSPATGSQASDANQAALRELPADPESGGDVGLQPRMSAMDSESDRLAPLASPKSAPSIGAVGRSAIMQSSPAVFTVDLAGRQSAPPVFTGSTGRHTLAFDISPPFQHDLAGGGGGGGNSGSGGGRGVGRADAHVAFGSAAEDLSRRSEAESIESSVSFSADAGAHEQHPVITSPIRRWLVSVGTTAWGSSQNLLRNNQRVSPVSERSKWVDSSKFSLYSRSSRQSHGFTSHVFSSTYSVEESDFKDRDHGPRNLKLNGGWALGWHRAGFNDSLKFQDPVVEEKYWCLKDVEKNPKFIWWWVLMNVICITLGVGFALASDYESFKRLAPKALIYWIWGGLLFLELVILAAWQWFRIRHETVVIVYLCLFNFTMIFTSPYRVGWGYWWEESYDDSRSYDDAYSFVLHESERASLNRRWRKSFKAEKELDDLDDRVYRYSDDDLPTLKGALFEENFLDGSTDSLVIQFMLLCIVGGCLAFDLRSSRSWYVPLFSTVIYAVASIPPGFGPDNSAYGVTNTVVMVAISFASWQTGRYREYADRIHWANSKLTVTLLDRFELISPKNPEHATRTSVVIRATDTFEHDEARRNVVIKLMRNKSQYDREIRIREVLEDRFVVDILHCSTDEHFKDKWNDSIKWNLPKYAKYKYGLVMPAAQRNLMVVLMQERVEIEEIRSLAVQIAQCLRHMHDALMIHSDLKPLNVVRMSDGETWKLIDLDAAVPLDTPVGVKMSTAHVPPETLHVYTDGAGERKATFRTPVVEKKGVSAARRGTLVRPAEAAYELLNADPSFDIWSFGVVLYRALARRPLLEADDADNLRDKNEENKLANWGMASLASAIAEANRTLAADEVDDIDRLLACDLLSWVLQCEPEDRPSDCEELLQHPFFEEERSRDFFQGLTKHPGWKMPVLHIQAALGDTKALGTTLKAIEANTKAGNVVKERRALLLKSESIAEEDSPLLVRTNSLFGDGKATNAVEPLLGRTALHVAAAGAQTEIVELLLAHSSVDVEAHDGAGRTALDTVEGLIDADVFSDDEIKKQALSDCCKLLSEAGLLNQVQRQIHTGVSLEEGTYTRNFCQSLVHGRMDSYKPRVMISYATGSRDVIDGEGCGLGMQYCHLIARHLDRGGISCFSGLHVSGGQNWKVYFDKMEHADVMLAVLTPAFYASAACLEEMAAAQANNLTIIPLLFELHSDGKPPWEGGQWTDLFKELAAKGESTEDLRRLKATCKALGKLNSEPAPPGTMMDSQVHEVLMKKLVKNTSSLLSIDALAVDRSATEEQMQEQRALADAPMQEDPPSAYVMRRRKSV